jgi:hypothetical protein
MVLLFEALRMDLGTPERPGPGFVPLALGIGLIGLSGIYFAIALVHRHLPAPDWKRSHWKGPLLATGAVLAYGFMLVHMGFALTTAAFIAFWVSVIESRRLRTGLVYALMATAGLFVIFAWGLRLRLPIGPF